jgi:hypothetical protein
MVLHNVHGGGMRGVEGIEVSFLLCVPHWFVEFLHVPELASLVVVVFPPTVLSVG